MFSSMVFIITGVVQAFRALVFARAGDNAKAISEVERPLTNRFAVDYAAVSSQARFALNVSMICFDFSSLAHWNVQC
jgi:hypothetical protein